VKIESETTEKLTEQVTMLTYIDEHQRHNTDAQRRMRNTWWRKLRQQKPIC